MKMFLGVPNKIGNSVAQRGLAAYRRLFFGSTNRGICILLCKKWSKTLPVMLPWVFMLPKLASKLEIKK